ncbi:hypothetical protein B0H67DRAFT_91197 [Lasiosphaeris hirsuta]|uniref:Uncharacterized protein n=1 Tax=Lasiosphaeris hirsuta TaxID=260670 RepID=A0AA40BD42_9PEZI|nr:hypothetical protein B0H67DRAFT_91197 [Lasiosphaeris hirsuta]
MELLEYEVITFSDIPFSRMPDISFSREHCSSYYSQSTRYLSRQSYSSRMQTFKGRRGNMTYIVGCKFIS